LAEIIEFLLRKATELKKMRKFEEAEDCLRKVKEIEDSKQSRDFWFKNGVSFLELEKYEEAIKCFNRDLAINNEDFDTYYKKGIALYKLKKFKESIECFNKAWESNYSNYLRIKNQIDELKKRKQYEAVLTHSTEILQTKVIPFEFWYYKGLALSKSGNYKEASYSFDQSLELVPDEPLSLFEKARCELLLGKKDTCMKLLTKTCTVDIKMLEKILQDKTFQLLYKEN